MSMFAVWLLYLAGAKHVTGQALAVDGGTTL